MTTAIPQLIDVDIYRDYFHEMLGGYEWTGRLYVSLCVVRTVTPTANWSDAAMHIGLDPGIGMHTARAASARMRVSPTTFADAVERARRALPHDRNFRQRESRVRALAQESSSWFESWRTSMSPARRSSSLPYVITWMWCEAAQGAVDVSPAWAEAADPSRREVAYRAFRDRLPSRPACEVDFLRTLVVLGSIQLGVGWRASLGGRGFAQFHGCCSRDVLGSLAQDIRCVPSMVAPIVSPQHSSALEVSEITLGTAMELRGHRGVQLLGLAFRQMRQGADLEIAHDHLPTHAVVCRDL